MAAVPDACASVPMVAADAARSVVPAHRRRAVAIAASPMELLRPESDLKQLIEGFPHVDLLVAADDPAVGVPGSVGVLGPAGRADDALCGRHERDGSGPAFDGAGSGDATCDHDDRDDWTGWDDQDGWDDTEDDGPAGAPDADEIARLELPGLRLHRLGLRRPLTTLAEGDLVAALSELVGFDPEPGVYCLAPAAPPGGSGRGVIHRAAQRIAQVYGLPVLRYRCLEFCVVDDTA